MPSAARRLCIVQQEQERYPVKMILRSRAKMRIAHLEQKVPTLRHGTYRQQLIMDHLGPSHQPSIAACRSSNPCSGSKRPTTTPALSDKAILLRASGNSWPLVLARFHSLATSCCIATEHDPIHSAWPFKRLQMLPTWLSSSFRLCWCRPSRHLDSL